MVKKNAVLGGQHGVSSGGLPNGGRGWRSHHGLDSSHATSTQPRVLVRPSNQVCDTPIELATIPQTIDISARRSAENKAFGISACTPRVWFTNCVTRKFTAILARL